MKTKLLPLVSLLFVLFQFSTAQFSPASGFRELQQSRKVANSKPFFAPPSANNSRSNTYNVALDYNYLDQTFANFLGSDYVNYIWPLSKYFPNDSIYTLRTAAVVFDTLLYADNNAIVAYHPRASSIVKIDSIVIPFMYENTTQTSDSIFISIFDAGSFSISGSGAAGELITTSLWDTILVTDTTLSVLGQPVNFVVYPNLQLNQGQLFGVKIDFAGSLSNKFFIAAGARDDCWQTCGANPSIAGPNSYFYSNFSDSLSNFSGFTPPFFNCDGDSAYTSGACEDFPLQNIWIMPCLTIQADTQIFVDLSLIPGGMNDVSGIVYRDANQNGVYDAGDAEIPNKMVNFNLRSVLARTSGFSVRLPDGNYTVTGPTIPFYTLSTLPVSFQLGLSGRTDTVLNFGYVASASSDSVSVMTAVAPSVCSNLVSIWVNVYNDGTQLQNVRVTLSIDSIIEYADAPGSLFMQVHLAQWIIDSLQPLSSEELFALLQMPDFQSMGDTVQYRVVVERMDSSGTWVSIASYSVSDIIVCSYDPNDKRVFPQGEVYQNLTLLNTPLHYNIRFQNTGNYPAIKVEIRDTLDTNLNLATFKLLGASHPVKVNIEEGRYVSFMFDYINLPDSGSNEPGSHGYVSYSIEPRDSMVSGTEVENTAHIYFDFNPAVVTNTTATEYVDQFPVGITRIAEDGFVSAIPNPFSESTWLNWSDNGASSLVKVYDLMGSLMLSEKTTANTFLLRKNTLSKGMYLVHIAGDKSFAIKVVVE